MTWERRWHPLREEWVTITSHRNTRPWSGASGAQAADNSAEGHADCHLCPGNARISGQVNPDYKDIFVFNNDHPSFSPDAPAITSPGDFFINAPANGQCRVVCYSPEHNESLATLGASTVESLIDVWAEQSHELSRLDEVANVMIFENKGEVVGVSNPHPHCQIYAPAFVPDTIRREVSAMDQYRQREGRMLMSDLIDAECADGRRLVVESDQTVAFVPYFARFPYEVYIVPRVQHRYLYELADSQRRDLAHCLHEVLIRYDNLWQTAFPYMLVVHQAPTQNRVDVGDDSSYHFHIQIHPPMRQPGLQKYLASMETGAGHFLNDGCPEEKAAELKAVSGIHYVNDV
jgi:UDPglucose--hexose-1-phosphate uridylyltransferase